MEDNQELHAQSADPKKRSRLRNTVAATALVGVGLLGGGVLASTMSASAASTTTTTSAVGPAPPSGTTNSGQPPLGCSGGNHGLDQSGTVTAVGTNSVTIKTSSATTTYAVTSDSDIDKNGEATLSDLTVGDAVRFNTMPTASNTIDKLHAGDESRDMPQPPPSNATSSNSSSSAGA